jgi:hypothetical protein
LVRISLTNINILIYRSNEKTTDLSYLDYLLAIATSRSIPHLLMDGRISAHGLASIPLEICAKHIDLKCMAGSRHGGQTRNDIDTILGIDSHSEWLFDM